MGMFKAMLVLGTFVFFFVGKLSSMRAERLFPDDWKKQEKENHSLRYAIIGILCMLTYLILAYVIPFLSFLHVPFCHMAFELTAIPVLCFGTAILLIILDFPEWYKPLKWVFVSGSFGLIFLFIISKSL